MKLAFKKFMRVAATAIALIICFTAFGCTGGREHEHEYDGRGVCTVCGAEHEHSFNEDGLCAGCGVECGHEYDEYGFCDICGVECKHEYSGRVCVICGVQREAHYDYEPHISALPSISIVTDNGDSSWAMGETYFDPNNPASKDRPYQSSTVTVSDCGEEYRLTATAGVKVRGNYTSTYPKKPFRIKFDKKQGMLGLNGGAKCKNWVLLADYKDGSMQRNSMAFYLSKMLLGSDGYYSSDFKQVEVYLNGAYWGVYLLTEQQQVNENRVNITEPDDNAANTDIGYLLEYDGYYNLEAESERFECSYYNSSPLFCKDGRTVYPWMRGFAIKNDVYPSSDGSYPQKAFVKNYMDCLYEICYRAVYRNEYFAFNSDYTGITPYTPNTDSPVRETVEKIIDIRSLADTYILNEIACDADIGWSSFYMDVDFSAGGDKLLRFEAPWDFDSAFGLKDSCASGEGLFAANSDNPWLILFIREDWFQSEIKSKWREAKHEGVIKGALQFVQTLNSTYASYYAENFAKWGFIKNAEWNAEAMKCNNHTEASAQFLKWLEKRFNYLDSIWL